jgi:hypothetical protein
VFTCPEVAMVAESIGSFLNIEQALERFMLVAAIGVLLLAVYEAIVMLAAVLATRANREKTRRGIGQPTERAG